MNLILENDDTKWIGIRDALRQSQTLAVAGQFAATVMHEINNPLEAISNLNYLLQDDADNAAMVRQYGRQIDEQLAILIRIAGQTLSFYRPAAEKSPVAASALAEAALRIHWKNIAAKRIRLEVQAGEAQIGPSRAASALALEPASLAAIAFGALSPSDAARLGWLTALDPGTLRAADALFALPPYFAIDPF